MKIYTDNLYELYIYTSDALPQSIITSGSSINVLSIIVQIQLIRLNWTDFKASQFVHVVINFVNWLIWTIFQHKINFSVWINNRNICTTIDQKKNSRVIDFHSFSPKCTIFSAQINTIFHFIFKLLQHKRIKLFWGIKKSWF